MADEAETDEAAPKSKKKLIIIIVAVVVLLGGGGAAYFLLFSAPAAPAATAEAAQAKAKPKIEPAVYVNIPQPIRFNVTGDKRSRLVQIKVQLMVRGKANEDLAHYHSPLIQSTLVSTFASATVKQLRSPHGRSDLRDRATDDIRAVLNKAIGKTVVEKVLFTDFVIQ